MSDYDGVVKREVVSIRILKTGKQSWYHDQIGKTVKAIRETAVDEDGTKWASYKQYPAPKGREPSGHYVGYEIEDLTGDVL